MLIREIKGIADYEKTADPNEYLNHSYQSASNKIQPFGEGAFTKIASIPGMPTNEVYTNGYTTSIFIMKGSEPIFLLNLTRFAKGYSTTNVVVHSSHTGQGFAVPTYLAVSKAYGVPLYSFGTHTPAGERIWQTLHQQYPHRVSGINVKTNQTVNYEDLKDSDFNTRAVLYPE